VLYTLLTKLVAIFFNLLNVLLAGNLPPFGCVCVIVEDHNKYLVIERSAGGYVFPGGFMRWREHPRQTVVREGREETGHQLEVGELIGYSSTATRHFTLMSTLTLIFRAEIVGGELKSSIEGKPCWRSPEELTYLLLERQKVVLEHLHTRPGKLLEENQEAP
jgi:ADP-ribose pyrophosphatase YjhB (NUDIX family)